MLPTKLEGCTFDDVILRPQKGALASRRDPARILTEMPLTRQLNIKVPIIAANMDTVTEDRTAIAMAHEGGVAVLHRHCSVEKQVEWLGAVKRQHSHIIEHPIVIDGSATVREARQTMARHKVSGLLVVQHEKILVGTLSRRDMPEASDDVAVKEFMTPFDRLVWAEPDISMADAERLMYERRIEKLPLLVNGEVRGLITKGDIQFVKSHPYASRDAKGRLVVGAAIGSAPKDKWAASKNPLERAEALVAAGVDFIVVDIAHGHSTMLERVVREFRLKFGDFPLVGGNIATYEGAKFLMELGVDAIKIGVGPGFGCMTRLETSFGVPQLQAIFEAQAAVRGRLPLIADGGLKHDGHIVLAIMAGASTVMVGGMLAGTDEAPGVEIPHPVTKQPMKEYRGMTSPQALLAQSDPDNAQEMLEEGQASEGRQEAVPLRGPVRKVIKRIHEHLCSAISYAGEETLLAAHRKISEKPFEYFVRLAPGARKESYER